MAPAVSGTFTIAQSSVARKVHVRVPPGEGPFPVQLLFHGFRGSGLSILSRWCDAAAGCSPVGASHILVAPDGYESSWNVVGESSRLDDVAFVGLILDFLEPCSNVSISQVQLYGFSNGAGLVNRILIESHDRRIVRAVTDGSQLNSRQHRDGRFFIGGASNSYEQIQPTLLPRQLFAHPFNPPRELLSLQGAQDKVIPAAGGKANGPSIFLLPDAESILAYAKAFGYTGAPQPAMDALTDGGRYIVSSYEVPSLRQPLRSYTVERAGHGVLGTNPEVDAIVTDFLLGGTRPPA